MRGDDLSCAMCGLRYLDHDESALQQYLRDETIYAEKWMKPLAALQQQLRTEMVQNSPNDQVLSRLLLLRNTHDVVWL